MSVKYGSYDCCGATTLYNFYESPFSKINQSAIKSWKTTSVFLSCILTESQMASNWFVNNVDDKDGVKSWWDVLQECEFIITYTFRNKGMGNVLYHLVRVGSPEVKGQFTNPVPE